MSRYLERYLGGEPRQVWSEIGGLVLSELPADVRADIQAVCDETMRRVRRNAENLIHALDSIGFELGLYPDGGKFPGFSGALTDPDPELEKKIEEIESQAGPLPLSLRTFWAHMGEICLIGRHPAWPDYADPLMVEGVDGTLSELELWHDYVRVDGLDAAGPFRALVAPDSYHKDNVSGGDWYGIEVPCRTVDARVDAEPHATTFVDYLRIAFQTRGFPGLEEPLPVLQKLDVELIEL